MKNLNRLIDTLFENRSLENVAIRVGIGEEVIADTFRSSSAEIDEFTLFDIASVSKIVCTTSLALLAFDKGLLAPDTKIEKLYHVPSSKKDLTVKNLMTHTLGIGWKPLFELCAGGDDVADVILNLEQDIDMGSNVLYSCPAFILLGKILEKVFGDTLDNLFIKYVTQPLQMKNTSFCPTKKDNIVNANLEDSLRGIVNDLNCRHIGCIAGNAGVFSNIEDLTKYAKCLLSSGAPIITKETFAAATKNYTPTMDESRGLGFLYVDGKYKQTGKLFKTGSIGHCGHTGQSVFVDATSGLYVIVLSDATLCTIKKYGVDTYGDVIQMREDIHNAILTDITEKGIKL